MANKFIPIEGFVSSLAATLSRDATSAVLPEQAMAKLRTRLEDDDYTMLRINDGLSVEIVRVVSACGNLIIERGRSNTEPKAFPNGSCVRYELTAEGVIDLVCQTDCCPGDDILPDLEPTLTPE